MSKVVIIGLAGEEGLWMVDLDQRTVAEVPAEYADRSTFEGKPAMAGVDIAVAMSTLTPVLAGKFDSVTMPLSK